MVLHSEFQLLLVWEACCSQVWSAVSLCRLFEFPWRQMALNDFKCTCPLVCLLVRSVYSSLVLLFAADYWTVGFFKYCAWRFFVRHVNYKPPPNLWPTFYSCWLSMNTSLKRGVWPVHISPLWLTFLGSSIGNFSLSQCQDNLLCGELEALPFRVFTVGLWYNRLKLTLVCQYEVGVTQYFINTFFA